MNETTVGARDAADLSYWQATGALGDAATRHASAEPEKRARSEEKIGSVKVLLVDDDRLAYELIVHQVQWQVGSRLKIAWAEDLEKALTCLAEEHFDAVLLDLHLPDADGMEGLARIREVRPEVPVLFLTGDENDAAAEAALQGGAQEYLVKRRVEGESIFKAIRFAIERHRLTLDLEKAHREQMELKSQLLSNVSHELRTPLATVHQFVSILADGLAGDLNPVQKEYLGVVLTNTDRLKRMIGDLLDASRAADGRLHVEPIPVHLGHLVDELIRSQAVFAHRRGVTLTSEIGSEVPVVSADPYRVTQVLTNLTDNAMKFSKGGTVTIGASAHGEGFVRVSVSDTGCGIEPEVRDRIFERLFQNGTPETAGLGLGLHISKLLVELLGGKIWLESEFGEGSTFFFTLPTLAGSATAESASGSEKGTPR